MDPFTIIGGIFVLGLIGAATEERESPPEKRDSRYDDYSPEYIDCDRCGSEFLTYDYISRRICDKCR